MTVKEPRDESADGFRSLLEDEDTEGLNEDEKMARIAKKMEMKFKQEGNQTTEQVGKVFRRIHRKFEPIFA